MPLLTEAMRAAVGSLIDWRVSYPVDESDIRRWALAVYYPSAPPAVFTDRASAEASGVEFVAPEEFNPFAWAVAECMRATASRRGDPDALECMLGLPPLAFTTQLNGGTSAQYGENIRVGEVIRAESRLTSYSERDGRVGRMLFSVTTATWTNQRGELVRTERATSIRY
ncbi:MAG: hypothetical protein JWQ19_3810 [Subtercola sp.]|nr:hypothetical protein [Subtercola sp.]